MAYTETTTAFFDRLPGLLGALDGASGVVEFTVEGAAGGVWTVDLASAAVHKGEADQAGLTPAVLVRAAERDFMALVEGRMSAQDGLLTERLHLAGDVAAIARLTETLTALAGAAG